jgi:hypothetical protein
MFTPLETCGSAQLHASLQIVRIEYAAQADHAGGKYELVTDLVTCTPAAGGFPNNSKGNMARGAGRKRPNVLSPIWSLRMNKLLGLSPTTRCNCEWEKSS